MLLQFFLASKLQDHGKVWMLLNPNDCEQNAQRVLKVWEPLVTSFKHARRAEFHPMLVALHCSFQKAHQLVADAATTSQECTLWTAVAAIPTSMVQIIAQKARIAFV